MRDFPKRAYQKRGVSSAKNKYERLKSSGTESRPDVLPAYFLACADRTGWEAAGYAAHYNLEEGRLELSNNRAERSIKPLVMGRKNWLANTPGGAQTSSMIYSLIETAKENGLDPYRYLLWVLQNAPGLSETDEAWVEKLLPANAPGRMLYAANN